MTQALQPQLPNSSDIKKILQEMPISLELDDGHTVNTLLVYLPCHEDGKVSLSEFFECIKHGILQHFVFSCSEIEEKMGLASSASSEKLFQKALRKISKKTAHGELGELILFTLLDVYLNAPKLLSKVSMKSSPKMPVFGADAVHGQIVDGEFRVYLGESKLHKKFKSAATQAAKSMHNAKSDYENEFDLLDSHMDFPNLNKELKKKIISILDPYGEEDPARFIHSPCFIGFSEPSIIHKHHTDYMGTYATLAQDYVPNFFRKVKKQGININDTTLLMLPFNCIDELVNEFVRYMGINK